MYINVLSFRTIARLLHTSATSVLSWVRKFAPENYEKPQPPSEAVVIQLDECGNRDTDTLKKLLQRLKKWNIKIYVTNQ